MSSAGARLAGVLTFACGVVESVVDQLELVERQRKESRIPPSLEHFRAHEAERLFHSSAVDCDRGQDFGELLLLETAREAQCADLMAVQSRGEVAENRVLFVSRDSFDDELSSSDAEGERWRALEERREPPREAIDGRHQQWVRARIDRVLMHRHRQLEQQVSVVLWKRGVGGSRDDRAHVECRPQRCGGEFLAREVPPPEGDRCQVDESG